MLNKYWLIATAAIALAATTAPAARVTPQFTSLTVFGDSLVDAGNVLKERGFPSPVLGYFEGRYTNGYDYTDLISMELFGAPTKASLNGGTNYANGGAKIVSDTDLYRDLPDQFALYRTALAGGTADANGLFVLNFGANDIGQGLRGRIGTYADFESYLRAAATQYAASVKTLNDLGARNILISAFPDLDDRDTAIRANGYLNTALDQLSLSGSTTLFRFDYVAFSDSLKANPSAYGLPPFRTGNCLAAREQATGCVGFATFDGYHPTAAVQGAIFQSMNTQFALTATATAVPEPSTWAMMLAGIGMIGWGMRRKRTTSAGAFVFR